MFWCEVCLQLSVQLYTTQKGRASNESSSPYILEPWDEVTGELTFNWVWKRSSCYATTIHVKRAEIKYRDSWKSTGDKTWVIIKALYCCVLDIQSNLPYPDLQYIRAPPSTGHAGSTCAHTKIILTQLQSSYTEPMASWIQKGSVVSCVSKRSLISLQRYDKESRRGLLQTVLCTVGDILRWMLIPHSLRGAVLLYRTRSLTKLITFSFSNSELKVLQWWA